MRLPQFPFTLMLNRFSVCAAFVVCAAIALLWRPSLSSKPKPHELTPIQKQLYESLERVQSEREAKYGNGHFVWLERDETGEDVVETRVEYWARENKFFRIDKHIVRNNVQDPHVQRLIERPEGISRIIATNASDLGQVYASSAMCINGSCVPPKSSMRGQYYIAQANRLSTVQVKTLIDLWIKGEYELTNFQILRNDSTACELEFTRTVESGVRTTQVEMDPNDFRVRSWTYKYRSFNGKQQAFNSAQYDYNGPNPDIPSRTACLGTSNFDKPSNLICELVEFENAPADLDIFDIPKEIYVPPVDASP